MNSGEIWLIDLNPTIGAEIQKTRPAVIVSSNTIGILPLKVIVPITDWKSHYTKVPWIVKLTPDTENNLNKISGIDTFQVRSVSQQRFVRQLGRVDDDAMRCIKKGLKCVLDID
jgi:mRNA interferase MazF